MSAGCPVTECLTQELDAGAEVPHRPGVGLLGRRQPHKRCSGGWVTYCIGVGCGRKSSTAVVGVGMARRLWADGSTSLEPSLIIQFLSVGR